jgi:hypothetical protein
LHFEGDKAGSPRKIFDGLLGGDLADLVEVQATDQNRTEKSRSTDEQDDL